MISITFPIVISIIAVMALGVWTFAAMDWPKSEQPKPNLEKPIEKPVKKIGVRRKPARRRK